jgi:hypothetical protein
MYNPDSLPKSEKEPKSPFLKKLKNSSAAEAAKFLTLGAGFFLAPSSPAQTAEHIFTQDKYMENVAQKKNHRPENYDLPKSASLNLQDLEGKKSLDPDVLKKIALNLIIHERTVALNTMEYGASLTQDNIKEKIAELTNAGGKIPAEYLATLEMALKKIDSCKIKLIELKEIKNKIDNLQFTDNELEITEEEKKYLTLIPEMITKIEAARQKVGKMIDNPAYLAKLQEEFNCSPVEARQHQLIRLSNLNLTNYEFKSLQEVQEIFEDENPDALRFGGSVLNYDAKYDNMIYFAYNYDYYQAGGDYLSETSLHEFLHKITRRNLGLSGKAIKLLGDETFAPDTTNYNDLWNTYFSIPTERYVRLKILENQLDELGIKKMGEKFTRQHYEQMIKLYHDGKLNQDASDLIHFTKFSEDNDDQNYEIFENLFNGLADLGDKEKLNFDSDRSSSKSENLS